MSIDDRDYYSDPKQISRGNEPDYAPLSMDDDAYWRKRAADQQELIRNWLILLVGIVALVWFFGTDISHFLKNLSLPHQSNEKVVPNTPHIIPARPSTPEQQFPESGAIIQYQQPSGVTAKFTVYSARGKAENCVVKLETWREGIPTIEIFVRAGEQAETQTVPLGDYRIKIACGTRWYGHEDMFGRSTAVSIGIKPLQFWKTGNLTHGNTLTLTKEIDGNFKTNDSYLNRF